MPDEFQVGDEPITPAVETTGDTPAEPATEPPAEKPAKKAAAKKTAAKKTAAKKTAAKKTAAKKPAAKKTAATEPAADEQLPLGEVIAEGHEAGAQLVAEPFQFRPGPGPVPLSCLGDRESSHPFFHQDLPQLCLGRDVALLLLVPNFVERGLRDVEVSLLDQLPHVTEEERQQEGPDV